MSGSFKLIPMLMEGTHLFISLFLLFSFSAKAQEAATATISGEIQEQETSRPIQGATVVLKGLHDSLFLQATITDSNGIFHFDRLKKGTYYILASYVGRKEYCSTALTINDQVKNIQLPTIQLDTNFNQKLTAVIVRSEQKGFLEQKIDRTIIHVEALISNTGANALDVLNQSPGVLVNDDGSISLRGREGVTIYIDNKPTYLSGNDLINYLKSLPSGMLEQVELIPNPPARYQADGKAGIINIRTKKIRKKGWNGNIILNYSQGVYSKSNESLNLSYRKSRLTVFASAGYSYQGNYYQVNRDRIYQYPAASLNYSLKQLNKETNNRQSIHYKAGADYDLSKRTVFGISLNGFSSPYQERGDYSIRYLSANETPDSSLHSQSRQHTRTYYQSGNIYLHHSFKKTGRELTINLDYLNYHYRAEQSLESNTYLPAGTLASNYLLRSDNPLSAKIYSTKTDYSDVLPKEITLETGIQSLYSVRDNLSTFLTGSSGVTNPDIGLNNSIAYREQIQSAYVNLNKSIRRFLIQTGLRVEHTISTARLYDLGWKPDTLLQYRYTDLFPTAYISYKLDSVARDLLTFSAGKRISRPGYQDLTSTVFYFDRNTSTTGNPLLQPEYTSVFELGYSHGSKVSMNLVYSRTRNMILQAYQQQDKAFVTSLVNMEKVVSYGINATTSFPLCSWWTLNLYSELMQTKYQGFIRPGEYIDRTGTTLRLSGNQQFRWGKGWTAEISGLYRSHVFYAQAVIQPGWQLHCAVQKKINSRTTISLTARDLFHSWIFRRKINIPCVEAHSVNTNDTRQIGLSFSYQFGTTNNKKEHKTGIQTEQGRL